MDLHTVDDGVWQVSHAAEAVYACMQQTGTGLQAQSLCVLSQAKPRSVCDACLVSHRAKLKLPCNHKMLTFSSRLEHGEAIRAHVERHAAKHVRI